jgi:hypothetical protein
MHRSTAAGAALVLTGGIELYASIAGAQPPPSPAPNRPSCPAEMARVLLAGFPSFCIDRWEAAMVDKTTDRPLSPYYPPHPKVLSRIVEVWQIERDNLGDEAARRMPLPDLPSYQINESFELKAVSRPNVVPQGYLTYHLAHAACLNAGKRLCTESEWVTACKGEKHTKFPYGPNYVVGRCNVYRQMHPAAVLHGNASIGLTDPRLNLVIEEGRDPLVHLTGATVGCASPWAADAVYDLVGNLDEWVEDPSGVFVGGFYSRMTTKGCDAKISSHAATYYDYSTGTRCCKDG